MKIAVASIICILIIGGFYFFSQPSYSPCGISLNSISQNSGDAGSTIQLYGNFGQSQGQKLAAINNTTPNALEIRSWSNDTLEVRIPEHLPAGQYKVGVYCNDPMDPKKGGSYSTGWFDFNVVQTKLNNKQDSSYGNYSKNDSTVEIKDFFYFLSDDQTKLTIVQAPSKFTEDEKRRIISGENDFMVLFNKESPNKKSQDWYPYVVTEVRFKSKEINANNIQSFYIKAYGIEQKNFTDNINSFPNQDNLFKKVQLKDNALSFEYSGHQDFGETRVTWSISI